VIAGVSGLDLFGGGSLGAGKKSLALEVTLQPTAKTLTDEEIETVGKRIIAEVKKATGGQIRQPGYKIGERIIRPARVAVAEPEPGGSAAGDSSDEDAKGDGDSED